MHRGYDVTFIRNITDIDDKVLAKAVESGDPFWSIAYGNERILEAAYRAFERVCRRRTSPRATGHITEMHSMIETLIDDGHAYVAKDNSGDVYFDVHSYPAYGQLSGQKPGRDAGGRGRAGSARKRNPQDFALWKGVKPGEPDDAYWTSPWGSGAAPAGTSSARRCACAISGQSSISTAGGLDLMFPHHENEIAQSRAAGLGFARYWVHHAPAEPGRGEDVEVARQRDRPGRGHLARDPAGRVCAITWRHRTTAHGSTTPSRRCGRLPFAYQRIEGFCDARGRARRRGPAHRPCRPMFAAAMDDGPEHLASARARARRHARRQTPRWPAATTRA